MEELFKSLAVSASGLRAQSQRMRVIAENMANSKSMPNDPDQEPYRRKMLTFSNQLDRTLGTKVVKVGRIVFDNTPFKSHYDPSHPGANDEGYVREPNVRRGQTSCSKKESPS